MGAAMEVHKPPRSGFLKSVHERMPAWELTGRQMPFERQVPITVRHKQARVGEYRVDFLVDGKIVLEIKAAAALSAEHYAHALHCLTATELRLALLLKFGARSIHFKRIIRQAP